MSMYSITYLNPLTHYPDNIPDNFNKKRIQQLRKLHDESKKDNLVRYVIPLIEKDDITIMMKHFIPEFTKIHKRLVQNLTGKYGPKLHIQHFQQLQRFTHGNKYHTLSIAQKIYDTYNYISYYYLGPGAPVDIQAKFLKQSEKSQQDKEKEKDNTTTTTIPSTTMNDDHNNDDNKKNKKKSKNDDDIDISPKVLLNIISFMCLTPHDLCDLLWNEKIANLYPIFSSYPLRTALEQIIATQKEAVGGNAKNNKKSIVLKDDKPISNNDIKHILQPLHIPIRDKHGVTLTPAGTIPHLSNNDQYITYHGTISMLPFTSIELDPEFMKAASHQIIIGQEVNKQIDKTIDTIKIRRRANLNDIKDGNKNNNNHTTTTTTDDDKDDDKSTKDKSSTNNDKDDTTATNNNKNDTTKDKPDASSVTLSYDNILAKPEPAQLREAIKSLHQGEVHYGVIQGIASNGIYVDTISNYTQIRCLCFIKDVWDDDQVPSFVTPNQHAIGSLSIANKNDNKTVPYTYHDVARIYNIGDRVSFVVSSINTEKLRVNIAFKRSYFKKRTALLQQSTAAVKKRVEQNKKFDRHSKSYPIITEHGKYATRHVVFRVSRLTTKHMAMAHRFDPLIPPTSIDNSLASTSALYLQSIFALRLITSHPHVRYGLRHQLHVALYFGDIPTTTKVFRAIQKESKNKKGGLLKKQTNTTTTTTHDNNNTSDDIIINPGDVTHENSFEGLNLKDDAQLDEVFSLYDGQGDDDDDDNNNNNGSDNDDDKAKVESTTHKNKKNKTDVKVNTKKNKKDNKSSGDNDANTLVQLKSDTTITATAATVTTIPTDASAKKVNDKKKQIKKDDAKKDDIKTDNDEKDDVKKDNASSDVTVEDNTKKATSKKRKANTSIPDLVDDINDTKPELPQEAKEKETKQDKKVSKANTKKNIQIKVV